MENKEGQSHRGICQCFVAIGPPPRQQRKEEEQRVCSLECSFTLMVLYKHLYPHNLHSLQAIGRDLYCASRYKPITHVEQIKWPMADFHLGQHLLFRKHAYTVTCHSAPGAPQRPTLPLRGGPPFCSVLKMISMHEISWGGHELLSLSCIPVWIFPWLVSVSACDCACRRCVRVREGVFSSVFPNGSFACFRGERDWEGDTWCLLCLWRCSPLFVRGTRAASKPVSCIYNNTHISL